MSPRNLRGASIVLAIVFALTGCYFVNMMIAAADMAAIPCGNRYSLFASIPRCRFPHIMMIIAGLFFALSISAAAYGRRRRT